MIAFDASVLIAFDNPRCPEESRLKVAALVQRAKQSRQRVLLPAPAVAEYLAGAGAAAAKASALLNSSKAYRIGDFGSRAALETAVGLGHIKTKAARKHEGASWAKAKFDTQIVAIAKVEGAHTIYTFDSDIVRTAAHFGITGVLVSGMPLPDEARQRALELTVPPKGQPAV